MKPQGTEKQAEYVEKWYVWLLILWDYLAECINKANLTFALTVVQKQI